MEALQLDNKLSLAIEPYKRKLRFVVYEDKHELFCRIETRNNIEQFLKEKEIRIFKGRLQLHKIDQQVNIEVKRNVIGCISVDHFTSMFQNATV